MTELLLLSLCLNSFQSQSCNSAANAYYIQSGDERIISEYGRKLEKHYSEFSNEFILVGALATIITQKTYTRKLMSVGGIDFIGGIGELNSLTLKKEY